MADRREPRASVGASPGALDAGREGATGRMATHGVSLGLGVDRGRGHVNAVGGGAVVLLVAVGEVVAVEEGGGGGLGLLVEIFRLQDLLLPRLGCLEEKRKNE